MTTPTLMLSGIRDNHMLTSPSGTAAISAIEGQRHVFLDGWSYRQVSSLTYLQLQTA